MALTLKQALALRNGDQLTFGAETVYTVLDVEDRGSGVYLTLKREDGYLTHATQHDLDVAVAIKPPPPPQHATSSKAAAKSKGGSKTDKEKSHV